MTDNEETESIAEPGSLPSEAAATLKAIQGGIIGFNKDHQRFAILTFADQASGRAFLADNEPELASGMEVKRFNDLFREIRVRRGGESGIIESSWTNLVLTHIGLELLGAPGLEAFPEEFRVGAAARATPVGDQDDSDPGTWIPPFNAPGSVHAMAIMASDTEVDLEACYQRLRASMEQHGVVEAAPPQDGNVRPDPNRGREHFGFKDGISQPAIDGLTTPSKDGSDSIAAGEFLIGHLDGSGQVSGEPAPAVAEGNPGYNPGAPTPAEMPMPEWAKDGTFVVYRRLRQDVKGFRAAMSEKAPGLGLAEAQLGAKLMGRWASGAPLERTFDQDPGFDPSSRDPSDDDPTLLKDRKINNFDYVDDAGGELVPKAAHIRKANPRSANPVGGKAETDRHRILRRGIPYGPEVVETEPAYGETVPADQDRGLLFLCYQASISRGFEFIQSQWANDATFPDDGDGSDPVIAQNVNPRHFNLPGHGDQEFQRWVRTTGAEYFFAPSLPAIRQLAGQVE